MPFPRHVPATLSMLLIAAMAVGCGRARPAGPPMGQVRGAIAYAGIPVAGASVVFVPTAKGARPAVGVTDAAGRYRLSTSGEESGAMVGPCQVAITCRAPYGGPLPEGVSPVYAKESLQHLGKATIPEKYFSTQTSGLSADVKPGRNTFNFTLAE